MENQVPEDVVKDRFDRLLALVQEKRPKGSSRFEGTVQEILVEEEAEKKVSLQEEQNITFWSISRDVRI